MVLPEIERDLGWCKQWQPLYDEVEAHDGWYKLESNGFPTRLVMTFASPGLLSAIRVNYFSPVVVSANSLVPLQPELANVRLISCTEEGNREVLYKKIQPVAEGSVSLEVEKQDRYSWDRAVFEFTPAQGVIHVKLDFCGRTVADLPCWDECMDRQKMQRDFVLHCVDNVDVHISSAVLMASCELFSDCRSAFKDTQSKSFDLTGADGFHSPVVLAVKQILESREMDDAILLQAGLGAEVVRLLYFFLVIGRERVWTVFRKALPTLSAEQFRFVVDLACDYGDMETLRVFGGFTRDPGALEYVANKMKENIHLFDVIDPYCFVCALGVAQP